MPRNLCQIIVLLLTVQPLSAATTGRSIVAYPEHSGFSEVAAPVGTSPSADGPESTLTITSSGPITVTGDSAADTLDFSVTPHTDISGLPTTYLRLDAGNGPVTGPLSVEPSDVSSPSLTVKGPTGRTGDLLRVESSDGSPMFAADESGTIRLGAESCTGNCSNSVSMKWVDSGFGELQISDPNGASTTVRSNEFRLPHSGSSLMTLRAWAIPPDISFDAKNVNGGRLCWGQFDVCFQRDYQEVKTLCVSSPQLDCTSATPVATRLSGESAVGTDIVGGDFAIAGGQSTGSSTGGSLLLQAASAGVAGTSRNPWSTYAAVDAGGFRVENAGDSSRPSCGAGNEFALWPTRGAPGAPSQIEVCLKSAADTYGWVVLVTG